MTDSVESNVLPFFFVLLSGSHASVTVVGLPAMAGDFVLLRELRLPVLHPIFEFDFLARRRSEHVNMVRHNDVTADEPRLGLRPDLPQQQMNFGRGEPWRSVFRADGVKASMSTV